MKSRFSMHRGKRTEAAHRGYRTRAQLIGVLLTLGTAALSPNAAAASPPCADEALRASLSSSQLPDCRAYEMVSPPYKEGLPLVVRGYASNGESAIVGGRATLADNQGSGESLESELYLDARTPSGWQLTPLNPPLSEYVGQLPLSVEADDRETLWDQHPPDQPASSRGLYVRSASGTYSFLGPLSPHDYSGEEASNTIDTSPAAYDAPVAATHDYSHVVLQAADSEDRWPFDATAGQAPSLYEYSGVENAAPTLIGVTGGKGSTSLIGLCGTTLGSEGSRSAYNALSADGETVFFTVRSCGTGPASAELYARLHGSPASPANAETVWISTNQCTTACGAESGKNFEGASEDGSLVYFTSTQRLTDAAVDGTAAGDAASGGGCAELPTGEGGCDLYLYDFSAPSGARLQTVSVGGEVLGVMAIAEDGTRVYYVSRAATPSAGSNPYGQAPVGGAPNVYVYDETSGTTAFVTTLGNEDAQDWAREFNRPDELAGGSGRFLLFASGKPGIVPDDASAQVQLFEYRAPGVEQEAGAPELVRVTQGEDGFDGDGNEVSVGVEPSSIASVAAQLGDRTDFKSTTNRSNVSSDGQTVFFATAGQLSPRAVSAGAGCTSVYEFHTASGALAEGEVHLISDGRDTEPNRSTCGARLQGIDAAGANALFSTADPLLAGDTDGVQRDTYDARIEGGFQPLPPAAACLGGLCAKTPGEPEGQPATAGSSGHSEAAGAGASPQVSVYPSTTAAGDVSPPQTPTATGRPASIARSCRRRPRKRHDICVRTVRRRARSARRASGRRGGR